MRDIVSIIDQHMEEPSARGLAHAVSRAIGAGDLEVGARMPTVRYLALELALSPTTVSSAWSMLIRSGAIRTEGRRGTFVAEFAGAGAVRYRRALPRTSNLVLDLAGGIPDPRLLPDLSSALTRLKVAGSELNYLDEPVLPELKTVIRASWPFDVDDILIVDGAMDALDQITRATLTLGDRVLVEDPTFPAVVDQLKAAGTDVVGVPIDGEGLVPDKLRVAIERGARALFLQPRGHNPTGATMTRPRARELARILRGTGALVLEDDSTGHLSQSSPVSLGQWIPYQTVHVRSYSKSHGPDLRLAAVSAPHHVMNELLSRRQLGQGWSSRLLQAILLHLLTDTTSIAELERAKIEYATRRSGLGAALRKVGVPVTEGDGLNLWLPVANETSAILKLAALGIGVAAGQPFTVGASAPHIRVSLGQVTGEFERLAVALATAAMDSSSQVLR